MPCERLLVNGWAECEATRAHRRAPLTSRRLLIGLSSLVVMLTIAGAVSFVRYAHRHTSDPQLAAVAPFDIFVTGLEPWRVRLAQGVRAQLRGLQLVAAGCQDGVADR